MPPAVAKPKNTRAPNDPTIYDNTKVGSLQDEYYRIKLLQMKMDNATEGLSEKEKKVMKQPSDLDMLTAKILIKLKTYADHDPLLNTYRAITGKEGREEIAQDLATRHYNKYITDHYIGKVVNSDFTGKVVEGRDGVRGAFRNGGSSSVLSADGLTDTAAGGGTQPLDVVAALTAALRALAPGAP
jgi:hypothetical protein